MPTQCQGVEYIQLINSKVTHSKHHGLETKNYPYLIMSQLHSTPMPICF